MRTLILFILLAVTGSNVLLAKESEEQQKKEGISKTDFRKKQRDFIIREAQLSPKEAEQFFPLFFELQDKKKVINDDANAKRKKALTQKLDERQYKSAVDQILNAHVALEQLEREYVEKYRKYLTNKKIFRIMTAELKFRRVLLQDAIQ